MQNIQRAESASVRRRLLIWSVAICLLNFIVFSPALWGKFLNWDDGARVTENAEIREISISSVGYMFRAFCVSNYTPLERLSCAIDYHLWGLDPWGFHLTNILFHALNAVWVFLLSWRLMECAKGATHPPEARALASALASLLFALHPLRVESVAWISERRDVLSLFFLLPSLLAWIESVRAPFGSRVALFWRLTSWGLFAASLLSKATGVTLPVVMMLMDFWPLRRFRRGSGNLSNMRRCVMEKMPFFILSVVAGLVAIWGQAQSGGMVRAESYGFAARGINVGTAIVFYLQQWIFPQRLSPLYPMPSRTVEWTHLQTWLPTIWVILITAWVWRRQAARPALALGWSSFLVMILPLSGLLQSGGALGADRYTYVAMIPLAILLGSLALGMHRGVLMALVLCLGFWTWKTERQITIWQDSRTLWEYVAQEVPRESLPLNNLATAWMMDGEFHNARVLLLEAVRLTPRWDTAWFNLGVAAQQLNLREEALVAFRRVLTLSPDSGSTHARVGDLLLLRGEATSARKHYLAAAKEDSRLVNPLNLALALVQTRCFERAEEILAQEALKGDPDAYALWAEILEKRGRMDQARQMLDLGYRHTRSPLLLKRREMGSPSSPPRESGR